MCVCMYVYGELNLMRKIRLYGFCFLIRALLDCIVSETVIINL